MNQENANNEASPATPEPLAETLTETPLGQRPPTVVKTQMPDDSEETLAQGPEAEELIRRYSRRAFLQAGVVTAGVLGGVYAFNRFAPTERADPGDPGIKKLWRAGHENNEAAARRFYFSETHRAPEFPRSLAVEPRNNYHGETPTPDLADWKMHIEGMANGPATLTFAQFKALNLPEISATTELKCVEGWSVIVNWTGVRLKDFMERFPPPPGTEFVAMRSEAEGFEDTWYYVGLDMPSCQHPQALLAYAMNGQPLTPEHGAPLRLIMPHKYGIKNIKLITHIAYPKTQPKDYWADRGYDYYAGL